MATVRKSLKEEKRMWVFSMGKYKPTGSLSHSASSAYSASSSISSFGLSSSSGPKRRPVRLRRSRAP